MGSLARGSTSEQIFSTRNHYDGVPPGVLAPGQGGFSWNDYWELYVPSVNVTCSVTVKSSSNSTPQVAVYKAKAGYTLETAPDLSYLEQVGYAQGSGGVANLQWTGQAGVEYAYAFHDGDVTLDLDIKKLEAPAPLLSFQNPPSFQWDVPGPGYITISTPGYSNAKIWYRFSGERCWHEYTGPVAWSGLVTLYARAEQDGYYLSSIATTTNY